MTKWLLVLMLGVFVVITAGRSFAGDGCDPCPAPPKGSARPVTTVLPR